MKLDYKQDEWHCKQCGFVCDNTKTFFRHLKEEHGMSGQAYYDAFHRKEGEGQCLICGGPTKYADFLAGYKKFCSTKCASKWQIDHAVETTMECKECGEKFTFKSANIASQKFCKHLRDDHGMTPKDYYDKYIKKPDEGICKICGKPTTFFKLSKGYGETCSFECMTKWRVRRQNEEKEKALAFDVKKAEIRKTEEILQKEWQEECARRLAELDAHRCVMTYTDHGIMNNHFGVITEWS